MSNKDKDRQNEQKIFLALVCRMQAPHNIYCFDFNP